MDRFSNNGFNSFDESFKVRGFLMQLNRFIILPFLNKDKAVLLFRIFIILITNISGLRLRRTCYKRCLFQEYFTIWRIYLYACMNDNHGTAPLMVDGIFKK